MTESSAQMFLNGSLVADGFSNPWDNETDGCSQTASWDWLYSMQPAYMSVICILGLLGNAFVLCIFCLQGKHFTVADVYLSNLAVADLVMVACLPFWAVTVASEFHWYFGTVLCKVVNTAISMNYYCSILFLTVVSVDRYLALAKPMSFGRTRGAARSKRICLAVWVVGFLLSLPVLAFRSVKSFPELGVEACYLDYPQKGWLVQRNLTMIVVGFLIPMPVCSFCVYHIIAALNESQERNFSRERTERKATHLVLVVLLVHILCLLPHQVMRFLDTLYHYKVISGCLWIHSLDIGTQISTYLAYANSALNPFLYVIVGKHFRKKAKHIFKLSFNLKGSSSPANPLSYTSKNGGSSKVLLELFKTRSSVDLVISDSKTFRV